jgi:hypothetical protein
MARPGRRAGQPHDQTQAVALRQRDDVVVFLPCRAMREMPAVLEIPLAVDLDVGPGELLPDPTEARLGDHAHRPLPLLRLDLLLEEGVDAEGGILRVGHRHVGGQQGSRAQGVGEIMQDTPQAGEGVLLPGHRVSPIHQGRPGPPQAQKPQPDQGQRDRCPPSPSVTHRNRPISVTEMLLSSLRIAGRPQKPSRGSVELDPRLSSRFQRSKLVSRGFSHDCRPIRRLRPRSARALRARKKPTHDSRIPSRLAQDPPPWDPAPRSPGVSRFCRAWPPCRTTAHSCPAILGHTQAPGRVDASASTAL